MFSSKWVLGSIWDTLLASRLDILKYILHNLFTDGDVQMQGKLYPAQFNSPFVYCVIYSRKFQSWFESNIASTRQGATCCISLSNNIKMVHDSVSHMNLRSIWFSVALLARYCHRKGLVHSIKSFTPVNELSWDYCSSKIALIFRI